MKVDKRPFEEIWADLTVSQKIYCVPVLAIVSLLFFAVVVSLVIGIDCALFWVLSYLFGFEFDFIKAILCTPIWFLVAVWISRKL